VYFTINLLFLYLPHKFAHVLQKSNNTITAPYIGILIQALKSERNLKVGVGIACTIIGILIMLSALDGLPIQSMLFLALLCMFITFTGLYFLLNGLLRYDIQKNYLLNLISQQPQKVVWVYDYKVEYFPFGIKVMEINILYMRLHNREQLAIVMSAAQIKVLMPMLKTQLPQATFGYSKHHEQLYDISPDLLFNNK